MGAHTLFVALILSVTAAAQPSPSRTGRPSLLPVGADSSSQHLAQNYGNLPLTFEANQGQTDSRVKFLSRGSDYTLFLTGDEAVFSLRQAETRGRELAVSGQSQAAAPATAPVLRMKLHNANPLATVVGKDELSAKTNYFIGNDRKGWRGSLPNYAEVKYKGIYPGIDLIYHGHEQAIEHDFVVSAGGDPRRIQLEISGATDLRISERGDLLFTESGQTLQWSKPVIYQDTASGRRQIAGGYEILIQGRVAFRIGTYDRRKTLTIDPVLTFSTYLGGEKVDFPQGIAVDGGGNVVVAGWTASAQFPLLNPLQAYAGGEDAFVTKIDPTGTLLFSTYLGGNSTDQATALTLDLSGNIYLTGVTSSPDFPTVNPLQAAGAGGQDAFVAKISASGNALLYSTYLGGGGTDVGYGIGVDAEGNMYLGGQTNSTNFPTQNPLDSSLQGSEDGFVSEITSAGNALVYSTYLGGSAFDVIYALAVDADGNCFVTGETTSIDFPTKNPVQPALAGLSDSFATEISVGGTGLEYSTYLGGSQTDTGTGLALDNAGNAYFSGYTYSGDFPQVNPIPPGGGNFLAKINSGGAFVYSSLMPGDAGYGAFIALDSANNVFMTGATQGGIPVINPVQAKSGGGYDAFALEVNNSTNTLVFSTYLGGSSDDHGNHIAANASGNIYITGETCSTDFPTVNPLQPSPGGQCDAFVSAIGGLAGPVASLSNSSLTFPPQLVGTSSSVQSVVLSNVGQGALDISGISAMGDFAQTNNCGSTLQPGADCSISVTFTPTATGARSGSVTITDNAFDSPQSVTLTGTGIAPAVMLSPSSLRFPSQVVGTLSKTQTTILTNTGTATLMIAGIVATGDFSQSSTCGLTVPVGGNCVISVMFLPTTKGVRSGNVTITDNAIPGTQVLSLSGLGTVVNFSSRHVNFAPQKVGTRSAPLRVKVTNVGSTVLKISGISIVGTDAVDFSETNNCGSHIGAGASCSITVTFAPTATGQRTAAVSITDNGGGGPQMVTLSGTGT